MFFSELFTILKPNYLIHTIECSSYFRTECFFVLLQNESILTQYFQTNFFMFFRLKRNGLILFVNKNITLL